MMVIMMKRRLVEPPERMRSSLFHGALCLFVGSAVLFNCDVGLVQMRTVQRHRIAGPTHQNDVRSRQKKTLFFASINHTHTHTDTQRSHDLFDRPVVHQTKGKRPTRRRLIYSINKVCHKKVFFFF